MPPKKSTTKAATAKAETPQCGTAEDACTLPLWDDAEVPQEQWGGDLGATAADPASLFIDNDFASTLEGCFGAAVVGWKRPTVIFSPFKPMVYRPQLSAPNPYTADIAALDAAGELPEDEGRPETQADLVSRYRRMRAMVIPESGPPEDGGRRVRRRQYRGDPSLMRAFNSALLVLAQHEAVIPQGRYAWELIHPQIPGAAYPAYNIWGKYAVRLFIRGAFRKIVVDDRLPVDSSGDSILSVTDQKEVWPALILKALLKALGPAQERRATEDPLFILTALLGGALPERIPTAPREMRLADALRRGQQEPDKWVICATVRPDKAAEAGLPPHQLYSLMDTREFQNTLLLRLCGQGAQWKGRFAYTSPTWTAEVEDTIGFMPAAHRSKHELGKQWNDFWIQWEDFIDVFEMANVFHPVVRDHGRYGFFKHLQVPAETAAAPPARGGKEGGRAAAHISTPSPATPNVPPPGAEGSPRSLVRWIAVKGRAGESTQMVVALLGLGRPLPLQLRHVRTPQREQHPFTLRIDRYAWGDSCPFSTALAFEGPWEPYTVLPFAVPAGDAGSLYRVTVGGMPPESVLSFMGPLDLSLGEERDVLKEAGLFTATDAGKFPAHEPGMASLWLKRWIAVKTPTTASFVLKVLPPGTDISGARMALPEAPTSKAKGPPAAKSPAKVASPTTLNASSASPPEAEPSDVPFTVAMEHVTLSLMDLDTGDRTTDHLGKIIRHELKPNRLGYALTAYAVPDQRLPSGLWKLRITSDHALDTVEARATDEIITRTGDYHHNAASTIFRFAAVAAEATTACLQATIHGAPPGVAFQVRVTHDDRDVGTQQAEGSCLFEHITLPPPDKTAPNILRIVGTLERDFTAQREEERIAAVAERFEADAAAQDELAKGLQAELLERAAAGTLEPAVALEAAQPVSGGGSPAPGAAVSPSRLSIVPTSLSDTAALLPTAVNERHDTFGISFTLTVHSSSARLDVRPDTQEASPKASAAKRPAEGATPPKGRPAKGQPVIDEAQLRAARARESRLRFLANPSLRFLPFAAAGEVHTEPVGAAALYAAPADEAAADDAKAAAAACQQQKDLDARTAELPPSAEPGSARHRAALTAILDAASACSTAHRAQRKTFFTALNDELHATFAIKPPTADEDDRKKKRR